MASSADRRLSSEHWTRPGVHIAATTHTASARRALMTLNGGATGRFIFRR
jgi:hypothetical protein